MSESEIRIAAIKKALADAAADAHHETIAAARSIDGNYDAPAAAATHPCMPPPATTDDR
jgi:hypothetical protein